MFTLVLRHDYALLSPIERCYGAQIIKMPPDVTAVLTHRFVDHKMRQLFACETSLVRVTILYNNGVLASSN
jgi:hypothetical protein